ncbi:MAG TPA: hypothetical protein VLA03_07020 [Draconibacterium sp.]|nr:hypothetical protein [Draconibacterium sp.]
MKDLKKTDIPEEAELTLKRNLIKFIAGQSEKLQVLIDLLAPYPDTSSEVVVLEDIEVLKNMYKVVEANRLKLMELGPKEFYENKDVKAIFKQIKKIRTRIVKV